MDPQRVYETFYRTPRHGAAECSDGGGPFGFDIHTALAVDYLLDRYDCDAFIETGCNRGDTTHYLAARYPELTVLSCDVVPRFVEFVSDRLADFPNARVELCDSVEFLAAVQHEFERPLFYLDAHWYADWPLERELGLIERGVIMIDDFDIGDPRFDYDQYEGVACGPEILSPFAAKFPHFYVTNPDAAYEFPCLQVGRRGGRGFCVAGLEPDHLASSSMFTRRETVPTLPEGVVLSVKPGVRVEQALCYEDAGGVAKTLRIASARGEAFEATPGSQRVLEAIDGQRSFAEVLSLARASGGRFGDEAARELVRQLIHANVIELRA